jgi:tetratricopeptide (TPR) repeat protein
VEGRPILVGLVVDILNARIMTLEKLLKIREVDFEASLVAQVHEFENPIAWAILFMAHIYHRFNSKLLDLIINEPGLKELISETTYQTLTASLPTLSFVRRPSYGSDFVLHDEMRRLVNTYCWNVQDPDKRIRQELSRLALCYYETVATTEQDEHIRQSHTVEMLFHQLFRDIDDGFREFENNFDHAIRLSLKSFSRSLFQEAKIFESQMSAEQQFRLKLAEARLLREEEDASRALILYRQLEQITPLYQSHYPEILYQRGYCHLQLSQFSEATSCFEAYLESETAETEKLRRAEILGQLGYICRRQGRLEAAMNYYEQSLDLQKELGNQQQYANVLNNMANVNRLQGRLEEALRTCKIGLRIRRELYERTETSERNVALSLSAMGQIYYDMNEIIQAEKHFDEAFEIYQRQGYKRGIAGTYNRLGQIQIRRGNFEQAKQFFDQAHQISVDTDLESQIYSLNRLGRLSVLQEKWKDGANYFKEASELASRASDDYQRTQNLVDLAEVYEHLEQSLDQILIEAEQIAYVQGYLFLLGRIEAIRGNIEYKAKNYRIAFRHYRVAARNMALHNPIQFEQFLRRLTDLLLDLPTQQLPGAIDSISSYWIDHELDKNYPELLTACREVSRHMIL